MAVDRLMSLVGFKVSLGVFLLLMSLCILVVYVVEHVRDRFSFLGGRVGGGGEGGLFVPFLLLPRFQRPTLVQTRSRFRFHFLLRVQPFIFLWFAECAAQLLLL